jgi:hypothetical protein
VELEETENFWEKHIFTKETYVKDYDSYFFLICSEKEDINWEAKCGSQKWSLRSLLHNWWGYDKFQLEKNGPKFHVKDYVDIYHFFTGYEQKGICEIVEKEAKREDKCMAWIIGLKFMGENAEYHNLLIEKRKIIMKSFEWKIDKLILDISYEMSQTEVAAKSVKLYIYFSANVEFYFDDFLD